jgi:hypothetical protein
MRLRIERIHDPPPWRKAILFIGVTAYVAVVSCKRKASEVGLIQSEHFLELMSKLKTRRFVVPYARVPAEVKSAEFALALMPSL